MMYCWGRHGHLALSLSGISNRAMGPYLPIINVLCTPHLDIATHLPTLAIGLTLMGWKKNGVSASELNGLL